MKRLLLILLTAASISLNGQSTVLKKYQVNASGYSNGLEIPSGFYVGVEATYEEIIDTNVVYSLDCRTYLDSECTSQLSNDSLTIPIYYNVPKSEYITFDKNTIFDVSIKVRLEDIYGSSNIVEP